MARVRMINRYHGMVEGKPLPPVGETFEGSDEIASRLVRFKIAEPIESDDEPETADERETATDDRREKRGKLDVPAVRKWASENGIEVPERGRIPGDVVEAYRAANQ